MESVYDFFPIIGYSNRLSAQPGDCIKFMVSCFYPTYKADIVHLIHGDEDPRGPGFKEEAIETPVSREYTGRKQDYPMGSYVKISLHGLVHPIRSFSFTAWIYPSMPEGSLQSIISWTTTSGGRAGLFLKCDGTLAGLNNTEKIGELWIAAEEKFHSNRWYFIAVTFDSEKKELSLYRESSEDYTSKSEPIVSRRLDSGIEGPQNELLIAASRSPAGSTENHFKGKIEQPSLFDRALSIEEINSLGEGFSPTSFKALLGAWDFSQNIISSTIVRDISSHNLNGEIVNSPKRGVKGHSWTGREIDFRKAPGEYAAIYFHEDDMDDAKWNVDFEFVIPDDFKSGVYAARLMVNGKVDYVPFLVRPKKRYSFCKNCFLSSNPELILPTRTNISTLVYSEDPNVAENFGLKAGFKYPVRAVDRYLQTVRLNSLYDCHSDGTEVVYASFRRPLLSIRPGYKCPIRGGGSGSSHQFSADSLSSGLDGSKRV